MPKIENSNGQTIAPISTDETANCLRFREVTELDCGEVVVLPKMYLGAIVSSIGGLMVVVY